MFGECVVGIEARVVAVTHFLVHCIDFSSQNIGCMHNWLPDS